MEQFHCTQADSPVQQPEPPPKTGIGFLAAIVDGLNDQPIIDALQSYHPTGRPGYPVKAMWRACLTKFILKIRYNNQLLERLRGSRKLRALCGFGDDIPSESVLSRFISRLADHVDLIEECLVKATNDLRHMVPAVKHRKNQQDQPLPPLGAVTAIDSTLFESYANPNRKVVKDRDARWGVKHSSRTRKLRNSEAVQTGNDYRQSTTAIVLEDQSQKTKIEAGKLLKPADVAGQNSRMKVQ